MLQKLREEIGFYAEAIVMALPGYSGNRIRSGYLRRRFRATRGRLFVDRGCTIYGHEGITVGTEFRCGRGCLLAAHGGGSLEIGNAVALNTNVHLNASGGIRIFIGNDVIMGPNVVLRSADHGMERVDVPMRLQLHVPREIVVEDDVWISANVVIVGGVRIGKGAVIGAGAVVTRDIPEYAIAVGVPAVPIASRAPQPVRA